MKRRKPSWFELPVMMKITLSTPHHALQNLDKCDLTRPHNFMMMPKISPFGYPPGVNPADPHFTMITQFTSERERWIKSKCANIHDPDSPTYRLSFDYTGDRLSVSPVNFYQLAESYQNHPEAKSLGPNAEPCEFDTCGLLQRAHIVAGEHIPIGKESDRHWEEGEDINVLEFRTIRYQHRGNAMAMPEELQRIKTVRKREFIRRGVNQHTLEKICDRIPVRASTLAKVLNVLREWEAERENQAPDPSFCEKSSPTGEQRAQACEMRWQQVNFQLARHSSPAQSQSRADTIVTAIAHEFRIAMPSNTSIPAATKSRPIWGFRSNSRPPATMRAYAANGKRT